MVEQTRIDYPPFHIPGECLDETETVEMESQTKSYCRAMECWTNCRHGGRCVYEMWGGVPRKNGADE